MRGNDLQTLLDFCGSPQIDAVERAMGIEPTSEAWEASVLPLNYARIGWIIPSRPALVKRKMRLTVNGQSQQLADEANLVDLISALQLGGRRLAIELNGEIVPRSQHAQTTLSDGDQIEIVQAVGGG